MKKGNAPSVQIIAFLLCLLIVQQGRAQQSRAQEVIQHADEQESLNARLDWAKKTATSGQKSGFWVGYSISKYMESNAWMGKIGGDNWGSRPSIYALVGKADLEAELPEDLRKNVNFSMEGTFHFNSRHGANKELYLRDIAVLVYYPSVKRFTNHQPADIVKSNMSLGVDLDNRPLYWLGKSSDGESSRYLQSLFRKSTIEDVRSDLLGAISIHENIKENLDFLANVLKNEPSAGIRENAAFWVGQMDTPEGLSILEKVLVSDKSIDVREHTVFAISQMSSQAALNVLIDLARNGKQRSVKEKAIFWLGQQASENAFEALEEIVMDEEDSDVQEQAVFALSQMPADKSIPKLIEIATTHANVNVRKKAIFWLGDSGDPRAVELLIELVQGGN
ncbi:MAG: HEAT repeat domain-containing protein [Rhodothermales bacterium]